VDLVTAKAALSLVEQQEDFAWVSVLDTRGSLPRHSGSAMLVRADRSITGSVGGGPLEAAAIEQALEVIRAGRPRLMPFDAATFGMRCGGGGLMLIDYADSGCPAAEELFRGLVALLEGGRKGWLVTVLPQGGLEAGTEGLSGDSSARRWLVTCADHFVAEDPARTYVQPIGPRGTAYVFGAGHCGQRLVPLLSTLGFFTVVVDDRPDFADARRFPDADRVVVADSFEGVVETLPVDEDSYLVIVTRGHAHDKSVLAQALHTKAGYVGMIGSKKKVADTHRALKEEGFSSADLARVHAPIGLAIGAETPEEIAVSIAAEMIQARAAKEERTKQA